MFNFYPEKNDMIKIKMNAFILLLSFLHLSQDVSDMWHIYDFCYLIGLEISFKELLG